MEQNSPYPPLMRAPLKMRGIFGVTWQLYKRGFWRMLGFSFLIMGLFVLILMLLTFSMLQQTGALSEMQGEFGMFGNIAFPNLDEEMGFPFGAVMTFMGLTILFSLIMQFLVEPAFNGALYMEMDQRMEGRSGTLYQLFRFALPLGLKRFYTTFLSLYLVELGFGIVLSMFSSILSVVFTFSSVLSFAATDSFTGMIGLIILLVLVMVLLGVVYAVFVSLVYPVAAHEGKRAFTALSRAFKLASKNFGRMLGAYVLLAVVVSVIGGIAICLPAVFLWQNTGIMLAVIAVIMCVWGTLLAPYTAAFHTALYVDAAARLDIREQSAAQSVQNVQPQAQPTPPQYFPPVQQTGYPLQQPMYQQPQPEVQSQPEAQPQSDAQPLPDSWIDTDTKPQDNTQE